ncbi:MAG: bifunctional adenosylcobinamide kinase/adenosylcobinamide-phosphate guanylyltransferase [Clostridiales bacterium]|nr:bifunctional adenosylcobinamide kinase/adenosylcobinamide-phosphate guanylyltransferase [Clostridiales bacterium]
MKILLSGGCKSGKSYHAQRLAKAQARQGGALYYVATMKSADGEDDERIARHRREREGWGFVTVERPADIGGILESCDPGGSFLLDSLTALLANEMFPRQGFVDHGAAATIIAGLTRVLKEADDVVLVSDFIYSDAAFYDPLTEAYRKSLAEIDRAAAELCGAVLEAAFGSIIAHKGKAAYEAIL